MEEKLLNEIEARLNKFKNVGIDILLSLPIYETSKVFALTIKKEYAHNNIDMLQTLFKDLDINYNYAFEINFNEAEQEYLMLAYNY